MKIQSLEYEHLLIASILHSEDQTEIAEAVSKVSSSKFHTSWNKSIWEAIESLHAEQEVMDYATIAGRMGGDIAENLIKLSDISDEKKFAKFGITDYSQKVLNSSFVIEARQRILNALDAVENFSDVTDVTTLPSMINEVFDGLSLEDGKKGSRSYYEIAKEYSYNLNDKLKGEEAVSAVNTGIADFDNITGGFNKDDLVVVAAPPGMGKSAFVIKLMTKIGVDGGSVLMQQLEMNDLQVFERSVGVHGGINLGNLRTPAKLNDLDIGKLSVSIDTLKDADIYIDDKAGLSMEEIVSRATQHCKKFPNTKAIIIDHLGLVKLPKADTRAIALGMVTARFKQAAKDLQVPFIILSQLNEKEINKRPLDSRRPVNSDIKDSSRVVEDADFIIFVYRHKVHDEKAPDIAELILGKARHAEQNAKCYMRFDGGNLFDTNQAAAFNALETHSALNQRKSNSSFMG